MFPFTKLSSGNIVGFRVSSGGAVGFLRLVASFYLNASIISNDLLWSIQVWRLFTSDQGLECWEPYQSICEFCESRDRFFPRPAIFPPFPLLFYDSLQKDKIMKKNEIMKF